MSLNDAVIDSISGGCRSEVSTVIVCVAQHLWPSWYSWPERNGFGLDDVFGVPIIAADQSRAQPKVCLARDVGFDPRSLGTVNPVVLMAPGCAYRRSEAPVVPIRGHQNIPTSSGF